MSNIVDFRVGSLSGAGSFRPRRPMARGEDAQILFFTGVRQRDEETPSFVAEARPLEASDEPRGDALGLPLDLATH